MKQYEPVKQNRNRQEEYPIHREYKPRQQYKNIETSRYRPRQIANNNERYEGNNNQTYNQIPRTNKDSS